MAELYRRICRIPNRLLAPGRTSRGGSWRVAGLRCALLGALLGALPWAPAGASAQAGEPARPESEGLATSVAELAALAEGLGSEEEGAREAACEALGRLEEEALPAMRARVRSLRRPVVDPERAYDALRAFRHAVGSRRADDMVDIAPGVLPVLAERRDRVTLTMSERVLLLRSLERIGNPEAGRAIADLFALGFAPWRWEARRVVQRMGPRALPMLLEARGHADRAVRSWARRGVRDLGMSEPGAAIQQGDNTLLADVLRAYGQSRDMDAMQVVVSFVTHERLQVREAARWATERYGQNAIWQLRRQHRNATGSPADRSWGWRRTMEALYAADDARRLAPVRAELEAGLAAHASGDLTTLRAKLDEVLLRAPTLPQRAQMAPAYAELGADALARDDLPEALRLFRRAVRLDPHGARADRWRGQLAFIEAEQLLSRGVADVEGYRQALAHMPGHAGALSALDGLTGSPERRVESSRRWAFAIAALLLALAAILLLRRRRSDGSAHEAAEGTANDDGPMDTAPDTLPG